MFQFALSKANRMKCFANSFCFGWTRWERQSKTNLLLCTLNWWSSATSVNEKRDQFRWSRKLANWNHFMAFDVRCYGTYCWLKIRLHSIRSKPTNVTEFEWPGCPASVVYCCFIARNDSSTNTLSRCQPEWVQLFQLCKLQVNCKKLQMEKVKRPTVNQFAPS